MNQTTSGDNLINTTIVEGLTDNVCPVNQVLTEFLVITIGLKNLLLCRRSRIGLFEGDTETFKECFVQNVGTDEPTIVRTLTLGVGSGDDLKTVRRFDESTDLLQEDSLTLKDRLKTEDLVRSQVNLV